jgi:acyl-CoA dehydrogenase
MIKLHNTLHLPDVGLTGFETPLSEVERAVQHSVHQFAKNVLRPIGQELDRMSPADVCAPDSPFWAVYQEAAKLGLDPDFFSQFEPDVAIRLESLIGEEMGWGDAGLGISLAAAGFPLQMAMAVGNQELVELCTGKIGCWMITHPDKGSDIMVYDMKREWPKDQVGNKGNLSAKVGHADIVINGQCSAWVSNGAVTQVALAYIAADYGNGYFDADGRPNGLGVIIPLDLPGVSRGKPLDKIGQRSLPQGEVYFDNVKVPRRFAVALQDEYYGNQSSAWSYAGTHMSKVFTGVARSAFELALQYCHERKPSREYPIEKIFRDARSALIEDGENTIITTRVGLLCQQLYAEGWSQN